MRSVRLSSILFLVAAMSATAACGGDDSDSDDDDTTGDDSTGDDSTGDDSTGDDSTTTPDGPSATCTMADVGTLTTEDGTTATYTETYYGMGVYVNSDATPDGLYIELYSGYTVFTDGFGPATADLSDPAEQSYATCGGCVVAYTDVSSDGSSYVDTYMPTAGTLDITEVSTTAMTGTLTGATLSHVDIADDLTTTDAGDGCTATVDSFSFDAIPEEDTSFARIGGQRWRVVSLRPISRTH